MMEKKNNKSESFISLLQLFTYFNLLYKNASYMFLSVFFESKTKTHWIAKKVDTIISTRKHLTLENEIL